MKPPRTLVGLLIPIVVAAVVASAASAATAPARVAYQRVGAFDRQGALRLSGALVTASVAACTTGSSDLQRAATFSAQMNAVPGTRTMSMSFDLYEQTSASSGYVAVNAPGFGLWQTSNRGIASFTANENVVDLPAPASFRALVHYRWLDRHGRVIRRTDRVTAACVETAPEPDLFIVRITRAPGSPPKTTMLYGVVVRNSGPGAAGAFEVAFSVNGTPLPDQQVTALAPQTATTVQFSGPRCTPGSTITAQVDPAGAITEPPDPSRTIAYTCPSPSGTTASGATGS